MTWAAGYWPNGGPSTDTAPTAAFTASCVNLGCTFDTSGSTDDHGIEAYGWTFGDGATGAGVTGAHTFPTAGTYTVTLVVTDTAGQTGSVAKAVAVTAPTAAVHLDDAIGTATSKKSGWTAKVEVSVKNGAGDFGRGRDRERHLVHGRVRNVCHLDHGLVLLQRRHEPQDHERYLELGQHRRRGLRLRSNGGSRVAGLRRSTLTLSDDHGQGTCEGVP